MDGIRADLSRFEVDTRARSADQVRMHEFFLAACSRNIYGSAYDMHQLEILEYNHWETLTPYVAVSTPRRWGKSVALSLLIAAYMMNVPNCVLLIFAPSMRVRVSCGASHAGGS